jgi:hypothetical protein
MSDPSSDYENTNFEDDYDDDLNEFDETED